MASIITLFSAVQTATKVIGKVINNSELESFAERLNLELKTRPFLLKHRAEALRGQLSNIYDKLLPADRQEFQNILSQSCTEQGVAAPFDANGNLDIHIDDFLVECENLAKTIGGSGEVLDDSSEVVIDGVDTFSDVADSVADSIWGFISSLFN